MALGLAWPAMAQERTPADQGKEPPPSPALTEFESKFLTTVNQTNLLEIAMGQLSQEKSSNNDVKEFGKTMVKDHQKANTDLTNLATRKNVTLPGKITDDQKKMVEEMKKSGAEFDRKFADHMVKGHEEAVALFKRATTDSKDADIRAFATTTLPVLEQHLKDAKALQEKLGKAPAGPKSPH